MPHNAKLNRFPKYSSEDSKLESKIKEATTLNLVILQLWIDPLSVKAESKKYKEKWILISYNIRSKQWCLFVNNYNTFWHHYLNRHEFEQALGVGEGQGSLACCSPWGRKESDMTEQLNWPIILLKSVVFKV